MSSAFTPARTRISANRFEMMVATGVLTKYDRIELVEGDMLEMAPIGTKHAAITSRLHELFVLAASRSATIVSGGSVNLGDFSEPQPDLMILKRRADFHSGKTPQASDASLPTASPLLRGRSNDFAGLVKRQARQPREQEFRGAGAERA